MAGHKADEIIALYLVDVAEQVGKIVDLTVVALCVLAVAVDVLTKKSYILVTALYKLTHLGDYILWATASLATSDVRHDTVGAEIVAAVHYRHPRAVGRLTVYRQALGNEVFLFFGAIKSFSLLKLGENKLGQTVKRGRTKHEINVRIAVLDGFLSVVLGNHATANADKHIRLCRL